MGLVKYIDPVDGSLKEIEFDSEEEGKRIKAELKSKRIKAKYFW